MIDRLNRLFDRYQPEVFPRMSTINFVTLVPVNAHLRPPTGPKIKSGAGALFAITPTGPHAENIAADLRAMDAAGSIRILDSEAYRHLKGVADATAQEIIAKRAAQAEALAEAEAERARNAAIARTLESLVREAVANG